MALTREALEERRERVAKLLLCGTSYRNIAKALRMSLPAVQRDVDAIKKDLRREQTASDLLAARARSLAVLRLIQQEAWKELTRLDRADQQDRERLNGAELAHAIAQGNPQGYPRDGFETSTMRSIHARMLQRSAARASLLKVLHANEVSITRVEGTTRPDVENQTTINVLAMPEWTQARTVILQALAGYPDARIAVADALAQVEAPDAAH